ncbi:MAG: fused MFS/spermidine synthase [Candidatus Altiarchaeota archaeon]|nr:fused MFS/spermidine synthase [Candidatus Altiarchaeota archaeon]
MKRLYAVVFAGGFLGMVAQLVFMREFFGVFQGNELVYGLVLGNWLVLTAAGSFSGGRLKVKDGFGPLAIVYLVLAASFPALVYFAKTGVLNFLLRGELASVQLTFAFTFAVLSVFCVLNGLQFILSCKVLSGKMGGDGVGRAYLLESVGALAGGVAFTFFFAGALDSFQVSYFASAAYFASALVLIASGLRRFFYPVLAVAVIFLAIVPQLGLHDSALRVQYPGQRIMAEEESPYGIIVVTRTSSQYNFFENGIPLFSSESVISREEEVHYAMAQRESPRRVLLVSGGVSGTINEILKYGVDSVDYVEIDPELVSVASRFEIDNSLHNQKVFVRNTDGRSFIKQSNASFDVVLVNVHDPVNAQLNRFYTVEYFNEVKMKLSEGGVVSVSLSSPGEYLSPESKLLYSSVYWTLKAVFKNVIIVPGVRTYFIASDGNLSYNIAGLIEGKGIQTDYVNRNYLEGVLTKERINYFLESTGSSGEINKDLKPTAYLRQITYWSRQFRFDYGIILAVGLAVVFAMFVLLKPTQLPVFTAGFMGTAVEVVLLVAYQVSYGSLYHGVGLMLAAFMMGLAVGAYFAGRIQAKSAFNWVVLSSAVVPLIACAGILYAQDQLAYALLMAASGSVVGMIFPLAYKLNGDAGLLYSVDLAGAFVGSSLAAAFLIPAAGLINTCIIASIISVMSWVKLKAVRK